MDDLSPDRIAAGLSATRFAQVEVHRSLPSTQASLVAEGGPDGRVVVADHQTAGRGRAGRTWLSTPGRALLFSTLLRGPVAEQAPLLSLAAGVAVARAVERSADLRPQLKWPNDVQLDGRKLCGILGELVASGGYVVLGVGVNVHQSPQELPPDVPAASLRGTGLRRDDLLVAILGELEPLLEAGEWMEEYRTRCSTLGSLVRVELPDGVLQDVATEVREDGALVVGGRAVVAADVVHLRPA